MKKILILLPEKFEGKLILNGFARGFELNKCRVLEKEITELTTEDFNTFRPDMVFGYDYSFLTDENCKNIIINSDCKNLVFYFADEPKSENALGKDKNLYEELKKLDSKIFIWDRAFTKEFKNCSCLPLAINPNTYQTDFSGYKHTICFVGSPLPEVCEKLLCKMAEAFRNKLDIFCPEEDFVKSLSEIKKKKLLNEDDFEIYSKCWRGNAEKEEDLAQIYNSSKINLNITPQGISSINYRVFSVLAAGGFLITDDREDLKKHFEISKHLEVYKNFDDLIDKIEFYLNNLNLAQRIAQSGRFEVVKSNTFSARAGRILKESIAA